MVWTPPKTLQTDDPIHTRFLNTHLRNNMLSLWEGSASGEPGWLQHAVLEEDWTNDGTTLADVTGLSIELDGEVGPESYLFFLCLGLNAPAGSDYKFHIDMPVTSFGYYGIAGSNNQVMIGVGPADPFFIGSRTEFPARGNEEGLLIHGLVNPASSVPLQLQAAQVVDNGTLTIYKDSFLVAFKVAA